MTTLDIGDPGETPPVDPNQLAKPDPAPEGLEVPEKFVGEDGKPDWGKLVQSYNELQAKQSQGGDPEPEPDPADGDGEPKPATGLEIPKPSADESAAQAAFEEVRQSFSLNGELQKGDYAKLSKHGISRAMADQFAEGQAALRREREGQIMGIVGGPEAYGEMAAWAQANLKADQLDAYNTQANNPATAELAVRGLAAQWREATGTPATRLEGGPNPGSHAKPFRSHAEMQAAMGDPRYRSDPAYQQEVQDRVAASDLW